MRLAPLVLALGIFVLLHIQDTLPSASHRQGRRGISPAACNNFAIFEDLPSIPHFWHTGLLSIRIYTCGFCGDAEFMRSVQQRYYAGSASNLAHASSLALFTPRTLGDTSYPPSSVWSPCSASLHRCTVQVPVGRVTLNRFIANTAWVSRRWWRRCKDPEPLQTQTH
jgi:hypothetical protein